MSLNTVINILIGVLVVWFLWSRLRGVKGLKTLTADQFQNELQANRDKILIDVREPSEVKQGYISGATNIPLSQLSNRVGEIPKEKHVYLYCRSGMRSKQAAKILQKHGYSEMSHLLGGISAWKGKVAR